MEKDLLDKLGQHLVWRMGRAEDEDVLVVRVGLASATPRFRELPRLLNLPEAEMRVRPIPLPPPSLEVEGWLRPTGLELEVRLRLPPGRTWGERAFARILEALFAKALEESLPAGARPPL